MLRFIQRFSLGFVQQRFLLPRGLAQLVAPGSRPVKTFWFFLLKYNGGRLRRHKFISHIAEHSGVVSAFFGLEGAVVSIEHQRELLLDAIPLTFLAIASDPFGNRYCIDCSSSGDEGIWYWIHEAEEDDNGRIVCEMHLVAGSFDDFLNQVVRVV